MRLVNPHSHLQSLDTGSSIEDFVRREKELDAKYLACTDHGTMAALYVAYVKSKNAGLQLIPGIEGYLYDQNDPILAQAGISKGPKGYKDYLKYTHITLHTPTISVYEALSKELSMAPRELHGSERKPIFGWKQLEILADAGATAGSGCLIGAVARHLMKDRPDIAEAYYLRLKNLFGDRFYVELFPHKCTHNWIEGVFLTVRVGDTTETLKFYPEKKVRTNLSEEISVSDLAIEFNRADNKHTVLLGIKNRFVWEETSKSLVKVEHVEDFIQNQCTPENPNGDVQLDANKFLYELAKKHGDKILVSLDSHIAYPEDKIIQDVCLAQLGAWRMHESYHIKSNEECALHFKQTMGISDREFEGWVENSAGWASRFDGFSFNYKPQLPAKFYPSDTEAHLRTLLKKHNRIPDLPEYQARLNYEIDVLKNNGVKDMLPYFFMFEEICEKASEQGLVLGAGRGSSAGVLINYGLGVTHRDPIKEGLSFERFTNLPRILSGKWPDIDQDLPYVEFLVGESKNIVEVELDNGEVVGLDSEELVETERGLMTIQEAYERELSIKIPD